MDACPSRTAPVSSRMIAVAMLISPLSLLPTFRELLKSKTANGHLLVKASDTAAG